MTPWLLALLAAPALAQTPEACYALHAHLCEDLAEDAPVVLGRSPSGGLVLNPAQPGDSFLEDPEVSSAVARGPDPARVEREFQPVLRALRARLLQRVEALPPGDPERRGWEKRLQGIEVRLQERERCEQTWRPFVGAFTGEAVILCPWMSHLAPEQLVTTLAHELGHAADPCWWELDIPALPGLPPRDAACSMDSETYADRVSAVLTGELLRGGPGVPALHFPEPRTERAGVLLFYALTPSCSMERGERLDALFSTPNMRAVLGCGPYSAAD